MFQVFNSLTNHFFSKGSIFTLAPLDWQAGKACQRRYKQEPSRHQAETFPKGKKHNSNMT